MKKLISLLITLFINCYFINAQENISVDKWIDYLNEMSEEIDAEKMESLYNDLSYLSEHPFDINKVDSIQLKRLPFLSDLQISNLLAFRRRYGKFFSLYELKNVDELDFDVCQLLLPFVQVVDNGVEKRPISVNNMLIRGLNEVHISYNQCLQQKKGFKDGKYLGEPFYHALRYNYHFDERIQAGLIGEKDTGEPFASSIHKGYDFYSAHLFLKGVNKWLKSLALGDYRISFGEGLVVSNDFTLGRSSLVTAAEKRSYGFRRHFSTNENDFFRGGAVTFSLGKIELSGFYSSRKLDASTDSFFIRSFKSDGLHRTENERSKMRNVPMQTYGGNLRFASPSVCVGMTALHYSFGSYQVEPQPKPYNLFYFRSSENSNFSVDYMLKNGKVKFYGETAISSNRALATLNALRLTPTSYISFLILSRSYSRRYQAFFGNAFSQNSSVQNEQGLYLGIKLTPISYWLVSAYADLFRFSWMKYGVDAPSEGKEYMIQAERRLGDASSFYLRYKFRDVEKSPNHRMRFQLLLGASPFVTLKTSADAVFCSKNAAESKGWAIAQSIGWKPSRTFRTDFYATLFHTDDYSSRIYSYEKNILYVYNRPSFFGKGFRFSMAFDWNITRRLMISARAAATHYSDRKTIGSGEETIEGNDKTDFYSLLRWRF